jgi:hypothetical protein
MSLKKKVIPIKRNKKIVYCKFIQSLYKIVNNISNKNIIEWYTYKNISGFKINDDVNFINLINKNNISSSSKYSTIARQLNFYGFKKPIKSKINFWFHIYFYKDSKEIYKILRKHQQKKNKLPIKNSNKRIREILEDDINYYPLKKISKKTVEFNSNKIYNNNILKLTDEFLIQEIDKLFKDTLDNIFI